MRQPFFLFSAEISSLGLACFKSSCGFIQGIKASKNMQRNEIQQLQVTEASEEVGRERASRQAYLEPLIS